MARPFLPPAIFIALMGIGCLDTWKADDNDGDGISVAQGDCWDLPEGPPGSGLTGAQIGPNADDKPYDGIDQDCQGNDDFDLDGDGYVPLPEHIGRETLGIANSGANHIGAGDCWDDPRFAPDAPEHNGANFTNVSGTQVTAADVHPDQDDIWYDGPDQDCGGNSDFDQDGDGFDTVLVTQATGFTGDDCVDGAPGEDPNTNLAGLAPDAIHPGATEVWYDGTDQDCSGLYNEGIDGDDILSDCDQDGDGAPVADTPDVPEGSACLDYPDSISRDCNDENAVAVPDPSVAEVFYNGVDDNCTPEVDGIPDVDGDADLDGYWAWNYNDLVPSPGPTVNLDGVTFDDCWDDADAANASDFAGIDVLAFDVSGDPDNQSSFDVAIPSGSLTPGNVHPGALDRPYDQVDQDCAGDNTPEVENDWDGDGYLSMYQWYPSGGDALSGDDCMDCSDDCDGITETEDPELYALCGLVCDNDQYFDVSGAGIVVNPGDKASSAVHPGAPDPYGDGTDQDCARNIDYDQDLDGYATDPTAAINQGQARPAYYYWDIFGPSFSTESDCNDDDTNVNPGMTGGNDRWYDGIDSDCAGNNDFDQDGDGYVPDRADLGATYQDTAKRSAYLIHAADALPGDDCVDDVLRNGANYNPGAPDAWYDGFDTDCADNDDYDRDADGYASEIQASAYAVTKHYDVSVPGTGLLTTDDCDDTVATTNPAGTETWYDAYDADCDEHDDFDADWDGHATESATYAVTQNEAGAILTTGSLPQDDCNDVDNAVYTGHADTWYDGIDSNCDEADDYDIDADGYAVDSPSITYGSTYQSTTKDPAYVVSTTGSFADTDCNDIEDAVHPGATDTWYDGIDHDCADNEDYDKDADGYVPDAYAGLKTTQSAAGNSAYILASTGSLPADDCVDADATYHPGATDAWYDSFDKDCADDDDFDADKDNHADDSRSYVTTTHAGIAVAGTGSLAHDDCNDTDNVVYTGATDTWYDGVDSNCDEADDYDRDADSHATTSVTYGSTYQDSGRATAYLVAGSGGLTVDDCNDTDSAVHGGVLVDTWYDGIDSDCDNADDYDADADNYVPTAHVGKKTYQSSSLAAAYILSSTGGLPGDDCVDSDNTYHPGATDVWYDSFDKDCADDDDFDADKDNRASDSVTYVVTTHAGVAVAGTGSLSANDCNDTDNAVYTGATDTWYDGVDSNCDDKDDFDKDADGFANDAVTYTTTYQDYTFDSAYALAATGGLAATDCNDTDSLVKPSATDTWYDGVDSNCDDKDDYDADADSYVPTTHVGKKTYQSSTLSSTYLLASTGSLPGDDCVDSDNTYHPGATDAWYDRFDKDCADNDDFDADADNFADESHAGTYATSLHGSTPVSGTGSLPTTDCNDTESAIKPTATDTWYDGVDSNCSDNDDFDKDADSYADLGHAGTYRATYQSAVSTASTWLVTGTGSLPATDCNDAVLAVNPGVTDSWYDGVDSDCGGNNDYDLDGDGYVPDLYASSTTNQGAGTSNFALDPAGDCNDNSIAYNPMAADAWYDGIDHDCQSDDDYDADGDGYVEDAYDGLDTYVLLTVVHTASADPGECNDTEGNVHPNAADVWYDGVDSDCGGEDDFDADNDGYVQDADVGEITYQSYVSTASTWEVSGTGVATGGDCLDSDTGAYTAADYYPTAPDAWYDGQDTDCSGDDDYDADIDGYVRDADTGAGTFVADTLISGTGSAPAGDCNDLSASFRPMLTDTWYDGNDTNCDSADDYDADSDGYVATAYAGLKTYTSVSRLPGFAVAGTGVALTDDCDDTDFDINSGAAEECDTVDNDCDGVVDESDAIDASTWYQDSDTDGFGNPSVSTPACTVPSGYVADNNDCNDGNSAIKPGATEVCDSVDNDCNGDIDDDDLGLDTSTGTIWYADTDGDGEGDVFATTQTCVMPSGYVANATDCDDVDDTIYSAAPEVCDSIDNDCDGDIDDADSSPAYDGVADAWFLDDDGDTYGDPAVSVLSCSDPTTVSADYVRDNTDCDDSEVTVYPGATEVLDGLDNDCDDHYDEGGFITADSEYVLITEILADPGGLDANKEWFEIHNPNAFNVTLNSDWAFHDGTTGAFLRVGEEVTILAGDYAVFGQSVNGATNGGVFVDYAYGTSELNAFANGTTGDQINLRYMDADNLPADPSNYLEGILVDSFNYTGITIVQKYAIQLDNDTSAGYPVQGNDDTANWCNATLNWSMTTGGTSTDFGTPGAANSNCPGVP